MRLSSGLVLSWLVCSLARTAIAGSPCEVDERIPPRPATAPSAGEFVRQIAGLETDAREGLILSQLFSGNLPKFLRRLVPITWNGQLPTGRQVKVTVCVAPDYLAVGSDDAFLFVPLTLSSALAVASRFGLVLPTTRIVDAIYQKAKVRLTPQPLPAGPEMRSTAYFNEHNHLILDQRSQLGAPLGELTSGYKKDLVLTPRLWAKPERVAIYGWHRSDSEPIQPLSTFHGARYADYSHGVRLVGSTAWIDGVPHSIFDVLEDRDLAWALSDEGPISRPRDLVQMLERR
jgi:hypothetical protein